MKKCYLLLLLLCLLAGCGQDPAGTGPEGDGYIDAGDRKSVV